MAINERDTNVWQTADYLKLAVYFIPAAILTWGIHELAHWMMGRALGYDMWITFNQVGLVQGSYDSTLHQILVGLAGPIVTWIQAILALYLIQQTGKLWSYSFLFLTLWMRAVAMGISYISNPNDEAAISLLLGLPMWVIPTISVVFLFMLTYQGNRILSASWKGNSISYVMASIMTTLIVFSDQLLFS